MKLEDISTIELSIFDDKILTTLKSLKPYKALGPDGLHAGFFQRFRMIMGNLVKAEAKQVFSIGKVPEYLNRTLITLIPKCTNLEFLNNYCPTGLCNTVYKVVTKLIVAYILLTLDYLVSHFQTAFVPNRKGINNAIIVQELIHTMSKKRDSEGTMAIKIDLEKAYDHLE